MKNLIILIIFVAVCAKADTNAPSISRRKINKQYVETTYKSKTSINKGNKNILILPGLEANRKTKELHIIAEATGLKEGETAEYFLIGENSGHDYEALAISFALPGDIDKALVFIGMEPGRPVNYQAMQFWPKGERVKMNFRKLSSPDSKAILAEKLIKNTKTGKTLPELGFVFTGSRKVTSATNSSLKALAADVFDPMSIAANYNEADSILDIPRSVKQSEVYASQVISTNYSFSPGELLDIIITPEYTDGKIRVVDLKLEINWLPATTNNNAHLLFNLKNKDENILLNAKLEKVLAEFRKIINSGHDPFVTINFANNLPLNAVHKICSILGAIDSEKGIRVESPTKGQLYYRSFLPKPYLRDREKRAPLKWEIHIKKVDGKVEYSLINIDAIWKDNVTTPTLKITEHSIDNSAALIKLLKTKEVGIPVLLVFAQSDVTYKQLMDIIKPAMPIYNVVHVFVDK